MGLLNFFTGDKKNEIIAKAQTCKGWTTNKQLSFMYDQLNSVKSLDGDILEIGSAWGRSVVMMGLASTRKIWSIDPHTGGIAYILKKEEQNSFDEFKQNVQKFNLISRVQVLKNTTQEVIDDKLMPENVRFAFAFIDGLHTADGVKVDIEFAFPRMIKGGIIMFDDYFKPSVSDMKEMIDEMAAKYKVELVKIPECDLVYFIK
ncbi:MAG: class I SAM-dependent methyltransferase [Bacteroidota bacterium]|nr:class I SAM-dependent methyltransferase [Bacteroidota bacterium]